MSRTIRSLATVLFRAAIGFAVLQVAVLHESQAVPSAAHDDEVLVTIPIMEYRQAVRSTLEPVHPYQRFASALLAGTSREAAARMRAKGIDVIIVDEQPWTQPYAVVTALPPLWRPVSHPGVRVLMAGADYELVKGSHEAFDRLRAEGYSCVEVERALIPVEASSTRLPATLQQPGDYTIEQILALVSDSVIRSYIQGLQDFVTRYWSRPNRDSVFQWVYDRFAAAGMTDVVLDSFIYNSTWQKNVVATMTGSVSPSVEIIIGGHLDSYSSNLNLAPGADDNASGTAAALEMARVLKLAGYTPAVTMRFMGFAAEEAGLRGSASYAQRARQANRDIRAMQNYDMIGYRNVTQGDRDVYVVWYTGAEALADLHTAMARSYSTLTPILTTSYRSGSDSYSFWQQGYKSVFVIERDFSPYYHSPNDLIQYLDIPYARDIIRSGLALALTLDALPPTVPALRVLDRGNGTTLVAQWDSVAVPDWYRYRVYVGTSPGLYDTSYLSTTRSRTLTGLSTGVRHYIGVSIVDQIGREGIILEESGTPLLVPLPPSGLTAQSIPAGIELRWRRSLELDLRGYNIYRALLPGSTFMKQNTQPVTDTTWLDTPAPGSYRYYVTALDSLGYESGGSDTVTATATVGVDPDLVTGPYRFRLEQNYPNPFNPVTQIVYEIERQGPVQLKVYDLLGQEVASLVDEPKLAGRYVALWNGSGVASGVYFSILRSNGSVAVRRMLLIR